LGGWLANLSSALGEPIGAAVGAGAIYRASVVAEREASKEALRDIARIIRDPSWSHFSRPSAGIERVFRATFGEHQLSWKCARRSVYATIIFTFSLGIQYLLSTQILVWDDLYEKLIPEHIGNTIAICISVILADYIALYKTPLCEHYLDIFGCNAINLYFCHNDASFDRSNFLFGRQRRRC